MLALRHFVALGHRRIAINLQATVTAYWLRLGIEQAASTLDVELFTSPVDLPARGEDPAAVVESLTKMRGVRRRGSLYVPTARHCIYPKDSGRLHGL